MIRTILLTVASLMAITTVAFAKDSPAGGKYAWIVANNSQRLIASIEFRDQNVCIFVFPGGSRQKGTWYMTDGGTTLKIQNYPTKPFTVFPNFSPEGSSFDISATSVLEFQGK